MSQFANTIKVLKWSMERDSQLFVDERHEAGRFLAAESMNGRRVIILCPPSIIVTKDIWSCYEDAGFQVTNNGYGGSEIFEPGDGLQYEECLESLQVALGLPSSIEVWFEGFEFSETFRAETEAALRVTINREPEEAFLRIFPHGCSHDQVTVISEYDPDLAWNWCYQFNGAYFTPFRNLDSIRRVLQEYEKAVRFVASYNGTHLFKAMEKAGVCLPSGAWEMAVKQGQERKLAALRNRR